MIREMFPEEVDDVIDLYMYYAPERAKEIGVTVEEYQKKHEGFREQLLKCTVIVYEHLGEIVGAIGLKVENGLQPPYGVIDFLCVKKQRANKHYGFRLMQAMEGFLRAEKCSSFITSPYKEQRMWRKMLKKYGCEELPENKDSKKISFRKVLT